jgi:hypothetical protein
LIGLEIKASLVIGIGHVCNTLFQILAAQVKQFRISQGAERRMIPVYISETVHEMKLRAQLCMLLSKSRISWMDRYAATARVDVNDQSDNTGQREFGDRGYPRNSDISRDGRGPPEAGVAFRHKPTQSSEAMTPDPARLTLYGSFTSSSSYKTMLYLALSRTPFSFRSVNLKYGAQKQPSYLGINRYRQVRLDITRWPNVQAWSRRLAALPGFALPYDLIPKKDMEFDPCV